MENNQFLILKRVLSHKTYEDNGMVFSFNNVRMGKEKILTDVDIIIPDNKSWIYPELESISYNILYRITSLASLSETNIEIITISINGVPSNSDIFLTKKDEEKLDKVLHSIIPKSFTEFYDDFKVTFDISYHNLSDVEITYDQLILNIGFNIDKITINDGKNKVIITTLSNSFAESLYNWLVEDSDTSLEDIRIHIEGYLYSTIMSDLFHINELDEVFLTCYLFPTRICGKKIEGFVGDEFEPIHYFRELISKSIK